MSRIFSFDLITFLPQLRTGKSHFVEWKKSKKKLNGECAIVIINRPVAYHCHWLFYRQFLFVNPEFPIGFSSIAACVRYFLQFFPSYYFAFLFVFPWIFIESQYSKANAIVCVIIIFNFSPMQCNSPGGDSIQNRQLCSPVRSQTSNFPIFYVLQFSFCAVNTRRRKILFLNSIEWKMGIRARQDREGERTSPRARGC